MTSLCALLVFYC